MNQPPNISQTRRVLHFPFQFLKQIFLLTVLCSVVLSFTVQPALAADFELSPEFEQITSQLGQRRKLVGNPDAPYLTEYSGVDCGACKKYSQASFPEVIKKLVKTGQINYRYVHFPLSTSGAAMRLHNAMECAADQGRFWQMKKLAYKYWPGKTEYPYTDLARAAGVSDLRKFKACVRQKKHYELIKENRSQARESGVRGIPAFELKDKQWSGARGAAAQIRKIRRQLKESSRRTASRDFNITVTDIEPEPPAVLAPGEKVEFDFKYVAPAETGVRIWGRPMTGGSRTSGYRAHPSGVHSPGSGRSSGYFYFDHETEVDRIRFAIHAAGSREKLHEEYRDVDYTWREGGGAASDTAQAQFLVGKKLFKSLYADVEAADSSVRVYKIVYPLNPAVPDTSPAKKLARLLAEKAAGDVDVHVLTSSSEASPIEQNIKHAEEFFGETPVDFRREQTLDKLKLDGQKVLQNSSSGNVIYGNAVLIDGEVLYLGNFVFSDNDLSGPNSPGLRLTGPGIEPTTKKLRGIFNEHFGPPGPAWKTPRPVVLDDFKLHLGEDITSKLVDMVEAAEERIDIGQYRLNLFRRSRTRPLLEALVEAHQRGVELNIGLQQSNQGASAPDIQYLNRHGIPVHLYDHPADQYHRFMVVDGKHVYLGSQKFGYELGGQGYGLSFTGKSRQLGRQISSYLKYWLERAKTVESEASCSRNKQPEAADKPLMEQLQQGELPESVQPDAEGPVGTISVSESEIQKRKKQFSATKSTNENFPVSVQSVRSNPVSNHKQGMNLFLKLATPEYPPLNYQKMAPATTINRLQLNTVTDPRRGEDLLADSASKSLIRWSRSFNSPGRERIILDEIPEELRARGTFHQLVPGRVNGYLLAVDSQLPWTPPNSELEITARDEKSLFLKPFREGEVLGLVGFNKEGKRLYAHSRIQPDISPAGGLFFKFYSPVKYLLVLTLEDYKKEAHPVELSTQFETRAISPQQGTSFRINDQKFILDRLDFDSEADTTMARFGTPSDGRRLRGVVALDKTGNQLRRIHWRRQMDPEAENRESALEIGWMGHADKFKVTTPVSPVLKQGKNKAQGDLYIEAKKLEELFKNQLVIEDYSVETAPHSITVHIQYDSERLDQPRMVSLFPRLANHQQDHYLAGEVVKMIDPDSSRARLRIQGIGTREGDSTAVEGLRVWSMRKGTYSRLFNVSDFNHKLQPVRLYEDSNRPEAPELNQITVRKLQLEAPAPRLDLEVDYRSDHGQKIMLMAELGTKAELNAPHRRGRFLAGSLLLESTSRLDLKLFRNQSRGFRRLEINSEELRRSLAGATHLAVSLYRLDEVPGNPLLLWNRDTVKPFYRRMIKLD